MWALDKEVPDSIPGRTDLEIGLSDLGVLNSASVPLLYIQIIGTFI